MPLTPDQIIDRKRLKAQLSRWRFVAMLAVFGALLAFLPPFGKQGRAGDAYIARISIENIMLDDHRRDAMIRSIKEDSNAKALIVRFNTPGGTALAGEEVFLQLRDMAKIKPVVAVMRTVCASAGYMAALGADHIIARENSLTGSIGVMVQSVEISRLMDNLGITPVTIKSGEFKDAPSLTSPMTSREREVVEKSITTSYHYFVNLIAERRDMDVESVIKLADGRVYTGREALDVKLIDALGGDAEALLWLAENHKISKKLKLRDIEPEPEFRSILKKLQQLTSMNFLGSLTVPLDGLVSVWHPSTQF